MELQKSSSWGSWKSSSWGSWNNSEEDRRHLELQLREKQDTIQNQEMLCKLDGDILRQLDCTRDNFEISLRGDPSQHAVYQNFVL